MQVKVSAVVAVRRRCCGGAETLLLFATRCRCSGGVEAAAMVVREEEELAVAVNLKVDSRLVQW